MHKNSLWLAWLTLVSLITLWYAGSATLLLWRYMQLSTHTVPKTIAWSIKEVKTDDFSPLASYTFEVNGKDYQGQTAIRDTLYRNSWGVEEDLKKFEAMPWKVWYDPSAPYHSSLQKVFPTKECLTALFLGILWVYFVGLGTYVARQMR